MYISNEHFAATDVLNGDPGPGWALNLERLCYLAGISLVAGIAKEQEREGCGGDNISNLKNQGE